jgi:hypothetical protein
VTRREAFRLFNERALHVLRSLDRPASQNEVAGIVGVSPSTYSRAVHLQGSWDTLVTWLDRWRAAGLPSLAILREVAASIEGPEARWSAEPAVQVSEPWRIERRRPV